MGRLRNAEHEELKEREKSHLLCVPVAGEIYLLYTCCVGTYRYRPARIGD